MSVNSLPARQVHLDFHTSPHISDVGVEFDAGAFAQTIKGAHINSVTLFAKCHHGLCYYPTKTGTEHPALNGRDLLGEQIEALHKIDVRCPVYVTVGWDEFSAHLHPEWRQMYSDGSFARVGDWQPPDARNPGGWRYLNFLHPDYQELLQTHVSELLEGYHIDGFFFDICMFAPNCCWSDESMKFRARKHLLKNNPRNNALFESAAQEEFAFKMSRQIRDKNPEATIFYNQSNKTYMDSRIGLTQLARHQTHFEIESLPSGFWGYNHFPKIARQINRLDKSWLGMTGRFQKMWGDFGGLKPVAALEYECFRTQALGGACSIGDQLPPRGTLDPAAYSLIRTVYRQVEQAEAFYRDSQNVSHLAVALPSSPGIAEDESTRTLEGAVQICEDAHYECAVFGDNFKLDDFELVVLPDSVTVTPFLKKKLFRYYKNGGKLLISNRSGFDHDGSWALDFLPLEFKGTTSKWPTYWRIPHSFNPDFSQGDRVFYERGLNVLGGEGTHVLVERVLPYFRRNDFSFSSHAQTPPIAEHDKFPAALEGDRFIYFSDPVFREYRQSGNLMTRECVAKAIERLIGKPPFGDKLPSTVQLFARRRNRDLLITLLHYIPQRKALEIDTIEEPMSFHGYYLRLNKKTKAARLYPSGTPLKKGKSGSYEIPPTRGRAMIEIPDYFE